MKLSKRLRRELDPAVRWIATALFLWRVYPETGPWTVAALGLITVAIEVFAWLTGRELKQLRLEREQLALQLRLERENLALEAHLERYRS